MERKSAETIVKVYAVLAWLGAILSLIGAFVFFGMGALGGIGMSAGLNPEDVAAGGFLAGLGAIIGVVFIILAIFEAVVGWGLWTLKPWARIATIVMSVLSLVSIPIGTIIGAVGIWLFGFDDTVKSLFVAAPAKPARKQ